MLRASARLWQADIYSLGVVLWELAARETPRRGGLRQLDVPRECSQVPYPWTPKTLYPKT